MNHEKEIDQILRLTDDDRVEDASEKYLLLAVEIENEFVTAAGSINHLSAPLVLAACRLAEEQIINLVLLHGGKEELQETEEGAKAIKDFVATHQTAITFPAEMRKGGSK